MHTYVDGLVIAVPGGADTIELLTVRLAELGLVGWVIDGERLGHAGWVLARVAADDDGALMTGGGDELTLLDIEDLEAELAATWPLVQVDEVVIDDVEVTAPLCQSRAGQLHEVAFATAKGMGLEMEASMEKMTLAEVRLGAKTLFARVQPIDAPEYELLDVFTTAKGGSVVLWRRDPHVMLQVLKRSNEAELHIWEPAWTAVGGDEFDELRDALRPVGADAAGIVKVLDLPADSVVPLRALLRRESPPLDQLCDLLKLPDEAFKVISGECAVEDLPGAVIHEPTKLMAAMREAMRPSDDDPAWVRWVEAGSREVRPWYVVSSLLTIALGAAMVVAWRMGGSGFWGVAGLTMAVATAIDLPIRWRRKRRRLGSVP